jgi:hypothetical protein
MAGETGFNPFNLFKQPNPAPGEKITPPQPNNGQPNNGAPNPMEPKNKGAGAGVDGNGTGTDNNGTGGNGNGTGSPLDPFNDLFKMDPNKKPAQDPLSEALFNLDPEKLKASASKLDFTRSLDKALVQKALQGDVDSFSQVLNQAFQGAFMVFTQMNVGMLEGGVKRNNERFSSVLDGRFRDYQVRNSAPKNPALQHPAAQPVLAAIRQHIAETNPNLSPDAVATKAEEYFTAMGAAMSSLNKDNSGGTGGTGAAKEPDYSIFLNS